MDGSTPARLSLVPPPRETPTVDALWLSLATGTAKLTPAGDGDACRARHTGEHISGYVVRQTMRHGQLVRDAAGRPGEAVAMFPGVDSGNLALGMAASISGSPGAWAVADVVFGCGHWQ